MGMYGGRKEPKELEHYKHFKNTAQNLEVIS